MLMILARLGPRDAPHARRRDAAGVPPFSEMMRERALAYLRAAPTSKVTVEMEVVRLLGELGGREAYQELIALGQKEDLHRDVRIAPLRAVGDHFERPETWPILERAVAHPDWVVASKLADVPLGRLSLTAQDRVVELLVRVLGRKEPEARLDLPAGRLRYAFTGTSGALGGPTTGPRGNLRDSDATPSRFGYPLHNWCIHFDRPVPSPFARAREQTAVRRVLVVVRTMTLLHSTKLVLLPMTAALALAFATGCSSASAQPASTNNNAPGPLLVTAVDVSPLVTKVKGAVVNITVDSSRKQARAESDGEPGSPFEFFFRGGPRRSAPGARQQQHALGTGFLIDARGHILTNAHVVEGADVVKVKLADERELRAKVKGRDERLDVAILELEGSTNLPFVPLGSSETLKVGETVVAIGNPFGLGNTVTMGIVSAKGRAIGAGPYDDFIQTDASINPGNSGGPLFNARGEVVGMNTAINPNGQGIGFAIPSDELKRVIDPLLQNGRVDRGQLGIRIQDVDAAKAAAGADTRGALVGEVMENSAAARAGLRQGDVIVSVDGTVIPHARDLSRAVGRHAPRETVKLEVVRSGSRITIPVVLDALPNATTG